MTEPPRWIRLSLEVPPADGNGSRIPPAHRVPSYLARRFHQIANGVMSELWTREGLVLQQFAMLVSIDAAPGLDQKRLAAELGIDRTNTGQLLDQLEAKLLVERRLDTRDRRVRRLWLTRRGKALRRRLQEPALAAQDRILASLDEDEKTTLLRLLIRVVEANDAYVLPGAGRRRPRAAGSEPGQSISGS